MQYLALPVVGVMAYAIKSIIEKSKLHPVSIMEFGCRNGKYTNQLSGIFPSSTVMGYDIDKKRIDEARRTNNAKNLEYTAQKPEQRFDSVVTRAVIHEDPEHLIPEMISFVKPGGLAGIVDYDMKGIQFSRFRKIWGSVEKNEMEETDLRGIEQCFAIHTKMGLEDYLSFFEKLGLKTRFAERKITCYSNTYHFIYIGQKS